VYQGYKLESMPNPIILMHSIAIFEGG